MRTDVARVLSLLALAGMTLAACAAPASAPGTESPAAPVTTTPPVRTVESPTGEAILELVGSVEQIMPAAWTLNGRVLAILPQTEIRGSIRVGDMVKAHAVVQPDGSLAAREIEPAEAADPFALPGAEFDFTGAVEAMAIDQWTVAGTTFAVTSQTEVTGTFTIGDLVKVHLLVGADGSLVAREIEAPGAGIESAPEGAEVELVGLIDSIAPGQWVVGGWTLAITPQTEIAGTFALGEAVKVHVIVRAGANLTAREIEAADVGDVGGFDDNNNANSNQNQDDNEIENGNENGNSNSSGSGG